jgi:hypothetical protein
MLPDPKPQLGAAACDANMDYYRSLRIAAHSQYLNYKRQERYWREELNKITPDDSSVTTAEESTPLFNTVKGGVQ